MQRHELGFGARHLLDDDQGPKYLNSPETPIYRKGQVLYGIDLAKRAIAQQRKAVIVEGYTDVMACQKATSFGPFRDDKGTFMQDVLDVDPRAVWEELHAKFLPVAASGIFWATMQ